MLKKDLDNSVDINVILNKKINDFASKDLRGKKVVLTGAMFLRRLDMQLLLESVGVIVKSGVSKSIDSVSYTHLTLPTKRIV